MRARLTYANVMSSIAVFLVLGGGAYAAATLPKNSVGSKQLKSNAVTSAKVKNGSLLSKDFKAGQLKSGPVGATGPAGPKGDTGPAGAPGKDYSPAATLPAGQTETGQWGAFGASSGYAGDAVTFRPTLANTPAAGSAHYLSASGPFTTACPGPGQAASGSLCVYTVGGSGMTFGAIYSDEGASQGANRASKDGFQIYFSVSGPSVSSAHGTWAVTG